MYPQVKLSDKDTVVLITPFQLKVVNKIIVEKVYFESKDSLNGIEIQKLKAQVNGYSNQVDLLNLKVSNKNDQIFLDGQKIDNLNFKLESTKEKLKRQRIVTVGGCTVGFSLGAILVLLVR